MAAFHLTGFAAALWFCAATLSLVPAASTAQLDVPSRQNTNFIFHINGEPDAVYLVEQSSDLTNWSCVGRSDEANSNRSMRLPSCAPIAFFRAYRTNEALFRYALAAVDSIELNGNNLLTDSFDSSTNIASTSRRYDFYKRRDHGDVACLLAGTDALNLTNAWIFGHVAVRRNDPASSNCLVNLGPSDKVGSLPWMLNTNTTLAEPGSLTEDLSLSLPKITLPFTTSGMGPEYNDPLTGRKLVVNGITYDMSFRSGDYWLDTNEHLSGKIYVKGNARIAVSSGGQINISGSDVITIGTNASLILYVDCPTASIGGGGVQNPGPGTATNFYYFGTTNNTSLSFAGNSAPAGCIYAPSANVVMGGGGGATNDFTGSVMAKSIRFNGSYSFHFDENLLRCWPRR